MSDRNIFHSPRQIEMASSTKFDNLAQTLVSVLTFRPKNKNKTYAQCIPKQNNLNSMASKGKNEYTYEDSHSNGV